MTRRTTWALLAALGVLVAVAAPVGWYVTRPPGTVGAEAAEALATSAPAPADGPPGSGGAVPTGTAGTSPPGPAVPAVPTRDGGIGAAAPVGPAPAGLELPSLGVRSAVRPVGVDRAGDLEIPEDVAQVGWYRFGPRPGDRTGSSVLSGHVDSAEQGRGAFFRLSELRPGDPVIIRDDAGKVRRYRVVSREEWPKSEVPLDRVFARGGAPRLTLVTCGGGFREDVRSYQDNIAVTAVPVG